MTKAAGSRSASASATGWVRWKIRFSKGMLAASPVMTLRGRRSLRNSPADPSDLAAALAFALRFQGRKRVHNADEIMAEIVAKRLVEHLERAGFVVMKRPPDVGGAAALGRGFEG